LPRLFHGQLRLRSRIYLRVISLNGVLLEGKCSKEGTRYKAQGARHKVQGTRHKGPELNIKKCLLSVVRRLGCETKNFIDVSSIVA